MQAAMNLILGPNARRTSYTRLVVVCCTATVTARIYGLQAQILIANKKSGTGLFFKCFHSFLVICGELETLKPVLVNLTEVNLDRTT